MTLSSGKACFPKAHIFCGVPGVSESFLLLIPSVAFGLHEYVHRLYPSQGILVQGICTEFTLLNRDWQQV